MNTTTSMLACLGLAVASFAVAGPGYHLLKTIPLPGEGGQDYLALDERLAEIICHARHGG